MKNPLKIDNLAAIGGVVGISIGVVSKAGIIGTLVYGIALSGLGYYIQNKIVKND